MPHPVDIQVGSRLRLRRTLLGLSQDAIAKAIGLTFQQVQKYETGRNRISCSKLSQFARILDVPPAWFFEDDGPVGSADLTRRETLEMVRAYYAIPQPTTRKQLFELIKTLSHA